MAKLKGCPSESGHVTRNVTSASSNAVRDVTSLNGVLSKASFSVSFEDSSRSPAVWSLAPLEVDDDVSEQQVTAGST